MQHLLGKFLYSNPSHILCLHSPEIWLRVGTTKELSPGLVTDMAETLRWSMSRFRVSGLGVLTPVTTFLQAVEVENMYMLHTSFQIVTDIQRCLFYMHILPVCECVCILCVCIYALTDWLANRHVFASHNQPRTLPRSNSRRK